MSKDAPATAADQNAGVAVSGVRRRKPCIYILLLGAILGALVGVLNLSAFNNGWKIQEDFFNIVDAPLHSLITPPGFYLVGWTGWRSWSSPGSNTSYFIYGVLAIVCYWTIIGSLLASLICLVRRGVIRDIARDKMCLWLLFLGMCGGILIGSFSFLATSNGWDILSNFFNSFNQPVISLMDALQQRYRILDLLPPGPQTEFISWNTAIIIYWAIVCLFLTSIYCVIRILVNRRAATGGAVAAE